MSRLFITGNSSGLGHGLTEAYLNRGWEVYGISRRGCDLLDSEGELHDLRFDLTNQAGLADALQQLLGEAGELDLVILNAGVLGRIEDLHNSSLEEIRQVMEINVWCNKLILDWLLQSGLNIQQIVLISSRAAVRGSHGWGAYALSKATLNMLTQLYAHEFTTTRLYALAPGLVDTPMQDYLCETADAERFVTLNKLKSARGTASMPSSAEAGELIADAIPRLMQYPSGSFHDIRTMQDG